MDKLEFRQRFYDIVGRTYEHGNNPLKLYSFPTGHGTFKLRNTHIDLKELFEMAAKKKAKRPGNFPQINFINYKFDKETKAAFDTWYASKGNSYVDAVRETLEGEHKLSISWDATNECFIASMTGKEDSLNHGNCITIRSADWAKALGACAYVHVVVFDGEVWDVEVETDMV